MEWQREHWMMIALSLQCTNWTWRPNMHTPSSVAHWVIALSCSTYAKEMDAVGVEKFSGLPIQLGRMGMNTDWKQGFAVRARKRSAAL